MTTLGIKPKPHQRIFQVTDDSQCGSLNKQLSPRSKTFAAYRTSQEEQATRVYGGEEVAGKFYLCKVLIFFPIAGSTNV